MKVPTAIDGPKRQGMGVVGFASERDHPEKRDETCCCPGTNG